MQIVKPGKAWAKKVTCKCEAELVLTLSDLSANNRKEVGFSCPCCRTFQILQDGDGVPFQRVQGRYEVYFSFPDEDGGHRVMSQHPFMPVSVGDRIAGNTITEIKHSFGDGVTQPVHALQIILK